MYTVNMEEECPCFQKSEYTNGNTFPTQQEAYAYANLLAELMNEEFCGRHTFCAQKVQEDDFIIKVALNTISVSGCSTGVTCDVGCGSTDEWTLESTDKSKNESCETGCGCA